MEKEGVNTKRDCLSADEVPMLSVVGVSYSSDLYPNIKYKILLLERICPSVLIRFHDLGEGSFAGAIRANGPGDAAARFLRLLWGHLRVLAQWCVRPTPQVYITYPGVLLALAFSALPRWKRPSLMLDAFISLYDTAVNDRRLYPASGWKARVLFRLERRAFRSAAHVLVDTLDNARFYSTLFSLPLDKFRVVPLLIPPLQVSGSRGVPVGSASFTCLFVGSLVPLHGVEWILKAASRLSAVPSIRFVIVGDGQQSALVEDHLAKPGGGNVVWHKGLFSTDFIANEIGKADVCLGIFGDTAKAERVCPYKLYYYAALGKPFVTQNTSCLREMTEELGAKLLVDKTALPERILQLHRDANLLEECAKASAVLYERKLGPGLAARELTALVDRAGSRIS